MHFVGFQRNNGRFCGSGKWKGSRMPNLREYSEFPSEPSDRGCLQRVKPCENYGKAHGQG